MTKDKKKNKKGKKPWPKLSYDFHEIHKLARAVIAINPYMQDRSVDGMAKSIEDTIAMAKSIEDTIVRAFNDRRWFVATAGWFAIFDRWEEATFVDLYVSAEMTFKKLQTHGLTRYLPPAERAEAAKRAIASRGEGCGYDDDGCSRQLSTTFPDVTTKPSHTYWPRGPQ